MTRGVRPQFRRWMGCPINNRHVQRCRSNRLHGCVVWCTVPDGHRTYSAVRPMLSFEVVVVFLFGSEVLRVDLCVSSRAFLPGTAPGTSCLQSCLVWHVMPPSRAGPRFPLQPGTRIFSAEGWCLVVTGDRMVATRMSHRTSSLPVTVASMDGFHCSSSCTGGMTWSGSDVSLHQALTSLDPAMIHGGWLMASHGHDARIHGECGPAFVERNCSRYRWRE